MTVPIQAGNADSGDVVNVANGTNYTVVRFVRAVSVILRARCAEQDFVQATCQNKILSFGEIEQNPYRDSLLTIVWAGHLR